MWTWGGDPPESDQSIRDEALLPLVFVHDHGPVCHGGWVLDQALHPTQGHRQLDQPYPLCTTQHHTDSYM